MSKKRKKSMPTNTPKSEKTMIIDATELLVKSAGYSKPAFRSGKYMTEKDRPRKKNWKREYCG